MVVIGVVQIKYIILDIVNVLFEELVYYCYELLGFCILELVVIGVCEWVNLGYYCSISYVLMFVMCMFIDELLCVLEGFRFIGW